MTISEVAWSNNDAKPPEVLLASWRQADPPCAAMELLRFALGGAAWPSGYLQATSTYEMTPEQRVEWEAEVRSLYHDGMVRIVVTPNWAKLIDFESTLPSAVEELVRQREERQHG